MKRGAKQRTASKRGGARTARRGGGVRGEAPITPLRIPRGVKTIVVFGGSFDPPHFYHTVGPLSVMGRLFGASGWLLYVPAARSPHKDAGPRASDEHRLAMLKRALDVPAKRSIWTDEIDRAAWARARGVRAPASFTIDTLRRLRRIVPARVTLRLLIGSDQAAAFHRWKDARKIIEIAEPIVMVREPVVMACSLYSSLDADFWTREEKAAWCRRLAPNYPLDAASTSVREAIPGAPKDPQKWDAKRRLDGIVTSVAAYIIEHNLYGFRPGEVKPAAESERSREIDGDGEVGRKVLARFPRVAAQAILRVATSRVPRSQKRR